MKQLTKAQAISFAESRIWRQWTPDEVVRFQLFQNRLAMDFGHFHKCLTEVLKRPVYTHELMSSNILNLRSEYLGEKEPPTLDEVIMLIPEEKRIIITK